MAPYGRAVLCTSEQEVAAVKYKPLARTIIGLSVFYTFTGPLHGGWSSCPTFLAHWSGTKPAAAIMPALSGFCDTQENAWHVLPCSCLIFKHDESPS